MKTFIAPSLLVLFFIELLISCSGSSFNSDIWDKHPSENFKRTQSPFPDSPDAVVIFDREEIKVDPVYHDLLHKRYVRIQIFSEAGKEHANIEIPYWYSDKIYDIRAQTILPDGRKIQLDPADIFDKGVETGWRYKTFALPGVAANCIIDYQYRVRDTNANFIGPKYFQSQLFTEYSKLVLSIPDEYTYNIAALNAPADYIDPEGKLHALTHNEYEKIYTWEYNNLHPIKDVEHLYNLPDQLFSLHMQMAVSSHLPIEKSFSEQWSKLIEILVDHYDSYLDPGNRLNDLLAEVPISDSASGVSPKDIYQFVRDNFDREHYSGIITEELSDVLKERAGTKVEKNFLTISLLRVAGFEADPVFISRRSNGILNVGSPTLEKIDHALVRVKENDQYTLIDAGNDYASFDYMPADNYSGIGLILSSNPDSIFYQFPVRPKASREDILTTATIDDDGNLIGSFAVRATGFFAAEMREFYSLTAEDSAKRSAHFARLMPEILVDSISHNTSLTDHDKAMTTTVHFQIPGFLDLSGDLCYVPTTYYGRFEANDLTAEKRELPVQFDFPFHVRETVTINLPANWEIIELPKNVSLKGPGIGFQKLFMSQTNGFQLLWSSQLVKLQHPNSNYPVLKNYFTEAVAIDQNKIVVRRKNP
ncbi:MAG: DUF3857 domain-containing protein [Candidatus Marinimicrobia bacterium]|nr:DUF3857 domain-containing protein [Candidatus Neomarinimicrobiota bacterium]